MARKWVSLTCQMSSPTWSLINVTKYSQSEKFSNNFWLAKRPKRVFSEVIEKISFQTNGSFFLLKVFLGWCDNMIVWTQEKHP